MTELKKRKEIKAGGGTGGSKKLKSAKKNLTR